MLGEYKDYFWDDINFDQIYINPALLFFNERLGWEFLSINIRLDYFPLTNLVQNNPIVTSGNISVGTR